MTLRRRLRWYSVAADALLALGSYQLAVVVFSSLHHYELRFFTEGFEWGLPLAAVVILVTFTGLGLYKLEAYVSRPLHLFTILKGTVIALVITAFFAFTFKAPVMNESRLTVFTAFARLLRRRGRRAHRVARQALRRRRARPSRRLRGDRRLGGQLGDRQSLPRPARVRACGGDRAVGQAPQRLRCRAGAAKGARRRRAGAASSLPGRRVSRPQGHLRPHRCRTRARRGGLRHRPAGRPSGHHPPADAALRDARDARAPRSGFWGARSGVQAGLRCRRRGGLTGRAGAAVRRHRRARPAELPGPGVLPPDPHRPARAPLRVPQVPLHERGQRRRRAPRLRLQPHRGRRDERRR